MLAPTQWRLFRRLVDATGWPDPGPWDNRYRGWTTMQLGPYRVRLQVDSGGVNLWTNTVGRRAEKVDLPWFYADRGHTVMLQSQALRSSLWQEAQEEGEREAAAQKAAVERSVALYRGTGMPEGFSLSLRQGTQRVIIEGDLTPAQVRRVAALLREMRGEREVSGGPDLTAHERLLQDD